MVYLQNSGIGNTVNPLLSLADPDVYGIPMLLLVGWRGQPGVSDEPQHVKQGRVMTSLLDGMEVDWSVLPRDVNAAKNVVAAAAHNSRTRRAPHVLLVEKGTFSSAGHPPENLADDSRPSREDAVRAVANAIGPKHPIVGTTGMLSRELFEIRVKDETDAALDFLTVGGMGHASSIALGIALAAPDEEVWCLDGDGALLMHLGAVAVIGDRKPQHFRHVVLNNGVHDSVGGQPTAVGAVDMPAMALASGYAKAFRCESLDDIPGAISEMRTADGPALLEIVVRPGSRSDLGRPTRSPSESREAFMGALGSA
jgi:phosphonopyruvate decarboxylase